MDIVLHTVNNILCTNLLKRSKICDMLCFNYNNKCPWTAESFSLKQSQLLNQPQQNVHPYIPAQGNAYAVLLHCQCRFNFDTVQQRQQT